MTVRLSIHLFLRPVLVVALLLEGCAGATEGLPDQVLESPSWTMRRNPSVPLASPEGLALAPGGGRGASAGPAVVIRGTTPALPLTSAARSGQSGATASADGGYVLNFDAVDIRDVVKAVLADMLGLAYVIDPAVQGALTVHTARPLAREAVLPAFEEALKLAGVALVSGTVGYQVVPLQGAAQRAPVTTRGGPGGGGYRVSVVPLRYAAAADIQRVLEPMAAPGTVAQVDPERNLIFLAGTGSDVDRAERTIELFDVDWLRSQSFGLFPLRYSQAKAVAADLEGVIGGKGAIAGKVRVTPIDHLNAILVASPRLSDINEMRGWIERFDRGRDATTPRLFVYRVQNGRAQDLARVLASAFGRQGSTDGAAPASDDSGALPVDGSVAASAAPLLASAPQLARGGGRGGSGNFAAPSGTTPSVLLGGLSSTGAGSSQLGPDLRITADDNNNALLIVATPERYAQVEAALAQLDTVPLQVMLEASIAEVNLTNQLKYGVQYYFRNGDFSLLSSSVAASSLAASTGGLSLAVLKGADIQAVLDLLSTLTQVRVISAPKLLVLNNRTASLQVGDQVPIATSSAVGVVTANAPIVNTIQLLDTGIILRVTPRANASGLVNLDIAQEVSASVPTSTSAINSPTIQQRRVSTSVAVQDGQTIAIGGLIRDNRNRGRTGIPLLKDIPVVGGLFGVTNDQVDRTELIVLITPHVVRDAQDAEAATDELRAKLPLMRAFRAVPPASR